MEPARLLGLAPKREVTQLGPDEWEVHITPPAVTGLPQQTLKLNKDQYLGYLAWENGQLIQDAPSRPHASTAGNPHDWYR